MTFSTFVEGTPVPQGSKSLSKYGVMYEANKALKPWRETVAATASWTMAGIPLMEGPLVLAVFFAMPRPPSVKREFPSVKPDLDKLTRAIGDALSGVVYKDDAQIIRLDIIQIYGDGPGAHIFVYPATEVAPFTHWLKRNQKGRNK
jgi:Holliday junction resolvase RusA-like endonuclease